MAHMALYRKWRPISFEDVVEQRHIVDTLKNSIKNEAVSHAYLFCGTRGTGKTTLAKIFARAVNCVSPFDGNPCNTCDICRGIVDGSIIDVIEIDAASNNGVDDVRQIKEAVMYVPAVAKYKVYIIDEVHMLSTGAFNALLKTLEEPPQSVVFILATTEPHKLPATILSRCQRFDFKRISAAGIAKRLKLIAENAGVDCDEAALGLIARLSEGGMRDAISLLDQCMALGDSHITREDVMHIAGLTASETIDRLCQCIVERDSNNALMLINQAILEGRDLPPLCAQLIEWFRNLMLFQTGGEAVSLIEWSEDELGSIKDASEKLKREETIEVIKELSQLEARLKWSENQRILMEVCMIKVCRRSLSDNNNSADAVKLLETRLSELEKKLALAQAGGGFKSEFPVKQRETQEPSARPKADFRDSAPKPSGAQKSQVSALGKEFRDWPDVVECVRAAGKMKVYAYLLDTKCILADDETAIIVVGREDGLKKTVLSRNDSLETISEAFDKITCKSYRIKVKDETELGPAKSETAEEDPVLEKIKKFAMDNDISLKIQE